MLELGIGCGESLRSWERLWPDAAIFGLDLMGPHPLHAGLNVFTDCDSSDPASLVSVIAQIGSPDLIIDDAAHIWRHQITAFVTLFPYLEPGGVYIIEDLETSFSGIGGVGADMDITALDWLKRLIDVGMVDAAPDWQKDRAYYRDNIASISFYTTICAIEKRTTPRPQPDPATEVLGIHINEDVALGESMG